MANGIYSANFKTFHFVRFLRWSIRFAPNFTHDGKTF